MKRPIYPTKPTVTPQQFGARADGKTDDIHALRKAREYASLHGMPLELIGNYYTTSSWQLDNVTVISRGARISYYGEEFNRPAVEMFDYVYIFGDFHVFAIDYAPPKTHGNRCGIAFGDYDSGRGAHHCYLEHPVLWGSGMPMGNGMLITGDSSDILFDKITVPKEHVSINVPVMIHWGNYRDHHPADLVDTHNSHYVHDEGYTRTKHPHDITIGSIDSHSAHSALYISAGYDITVGEVRQYGGVSAVRVVAGDCGFKYASPAEKAHGSKNIRIGRVIGKSIKRFGIVLNGLYGYEANMWTKPCVQIDEAILEACGEGSDNGVCFDGLQSAEFGKLTVKNFAKAALRLSMHNKQIRIDELNVEDCTSSVFSTYDSLHQKMRSGEEYDCDPTEGVEIERLTVRNCGSSGVSLADVPHINGLTVKDTTLVQCRFDSLLRVYEDTKKVCFENLTLCNSPLTAPLIDGTDEMIQQNELCISVANR